MANEFPQIQDSRPVFNPITINSEAEGHEAFAKTLGSLATQAGEKTAEMASDQSQTMYINSVANIEQIKTSAQINMLEKPGNATKIAEQTNNALDIVKQSAFVNSKDRTKLNSYISGAADDIELKAVETNVKQRQLEAGFTHYANWPDQLKAYQQALISDPAKADNLKEAMISSLHGLVSIGAITPLQAGSSIQSMSDMVGVAADHHMMYGNSNATAKDYHTATSDPLNPGQPASPTAPVNQATSWMTDYYNNDKSFQGVMASLSNHMRPNPAAFDSLPTHQRQQAVLFMQGGMQSDGYINSGEPFPAIEKKYQELTEKNQILSYRDQGLRNGLASYIQELKNGNYLKVMAKTAIGNGIMQDFVARDSAIRNSPVDDEQKQTLLNQNQDSMVTAAVAYGHAHHIPSEYINPVPSTDVATMQQGFQRGQNPATILQTLGKYSKGTQGYLAQSMKDPEQKIVTQALINAPGTIRPEDQLDFIAANQQGRNYSSETFKEGEDTKDKKLAARIAANLAPAMRMIGRQYDPENAQTLQTAMLSTTLKYAKFIAQKDNNIPMDEKTGFNMNIFGDAQWKKYVDKASQIYGASFAQQSGTNWVVNPQQLPQPLTNNELDVLADHVTNEGYNYLKEGRNGGQYEAARSRNALTMRITPTNDVQAVDENGKVYYTTPFTTDLIHHARVKAKERQAVIAKSNAEFAERYSPRPDMVGG